MVWKPQKDEPLTDFDKKIIGTLWCILEIPLEDRILLKKVGDMLAGLGRDISVNAGREITRRELAVIVKHRVGEIRQRIRDHATEIGVSVPRAGQRARRIAEQAANETGITKVTSVVEPLHRVVRN